MTEKKQEQAITADEARHVLEAERRRKLEACRAQIQAILQENGYILVGVPKLIRQGNTWAMVADVTLEEAP